MRVGSFKIIEVCYWSEGERSRFSDMSADGTRKIGGRRNQASLSHKYHDAVASTTVAGRTRLNYPTLIDEWMQFAEGK